MDSNKPIIVKMKQEINDDSKNAFTELFTMKDEIEGIKVEVEDDDHIFDYENISENQMEERYEQCKGMISFE